jgi:hypothetical protein
MGFKPNELGHGCNYDIVCPNVAILCTWDGKKMVPKGFSFTLQKIHFPFFEYQVFFLCEAPLFDQPNFQK